LVDIKREGRFTPLFFFKREFGISFHNNILVTDNLTAEEYKARTGRYRYIISPEGVEHPGVFAVL
jgi:hypothetical protein